MTTTAAALLEAFRTIRTQERKQRRRSRKVVAVVDALPKAAEALTTIIFFSTTTTRGHYTFQCGRGRLRGRRLGILQSHPVGPVMSSL